MKLSSERILTTRTGSLPRPADLVTRLEWLGQDCQYDTQQRDKRCTDVRRFLRLINTDMVFGTHRGHENDSRRGRKGLPSEGTFATRITHVMECLCRALVSDKSLY